MANERATRDIERAEDDSALLGPQQSGEVRWYRTPEGDYLAIASITFAVGVKEVKRRAECHGETPGKAMAEALRCARFEG